MPAIAAATVIDIAGAIAAMGLCYDARDNGAWMGLVGFPGVRAKVRGFGSPMYRATRLRREEIKAFNFDEALGDTILIDVEGLEDEDGRPLSAGHMRPLLGEKPYRAFRLAIIDAASAIDDAPALCRPRNPCSWCPRRKCP